MRLSLLTFFTALTLPLSVMAKTEPTPPTALSNMVDNGAQIFYLGNYEDMNGWALVRQGQPEYFYENKDRTALVMGMLFSDEGDLITMAQLKDLYERIGDDMYATTGGAVMAQIESTIQKMPASTPEPQAQTQSFEPVKPLTRAEQMFADVVSANWITLNPEGQHDVFAFIDPDCPHCRNFINDILTSDNKELRLRILPMGANTQSQKRAALLLAAADPIDRLSRYINGDKEALNAPDNINVKGVEKNFSVMMKHGFDVTPITVYRTGKKEIRLVRGRPADLDTVLNDIKNN